MVISYINKVVSPALSSFFVSNEKGLLRGAFVPETHQGLVENPHLAGAPESLGIAPELELEPHVHEGPNTALHGGNLTDFVALVADRGVHVFGVRGLEPFQGLGHLGGLRREDLLLLGHAAAEDDGRDEEGRGEDDVLQHV